MIFSGHLYQQVEDDEKTVTRRHLRGGTFDGVATRSARGRVQYRVGGNYSAQPKRGVAGRGRIRILSICYSHEYGEIDDAEARREGFEDVASFMARWRELYGELSPYDSSVVRIEFARLK